MIKKKQYILVLLSLLLLTGCSFFKAPGVGIAVSPKTQDVAVQDYTGEAFSFFLTKVEATPSLQTDIVKNNMTIRVNSTVGCVIFDAINIYDNISYFQSLILSTTATTITLNSQIDRDFSTSNTIIECAEWDLSTSDGSVVPETFSIRPPTSRTWHTISTVFNCLDNTVMDSAKFCGGPQLTNGISGRVIDGYQKDLFLIYNNNGFKLRGFDLEYILKAPAGVYGLNAELIFKDKYGAVVELNGDTNDTWQAVNRDDLTTQEEIAITVNGHYVSD